MLDQFLALARKPNPTHDTRERFPNYELGWFCTTAFNRAVDFYRDFADADFVRWAWKAIEAADLLDCDGGTGGMGPLLRENLRLLGLENS